MRRRGLVIAIVCARLLLPSLARATIFGAMSEPCLIDTSADLFRWDAMGTGVPSVVRTGLDAMTGNLCALSYQPASGATMYVADTLPSAQSTVNLTCRIKVTAMGTSQRRLATFVNGASTGLILTLGKATTNFATLTAWHGNTTSSVCSGSTFNDSVCTPVVDPDCANQLRDLPFTSDGTNPCPETQHCEATCTPAKYATMDIALNSWRAFTVQQANHATLKETTLSLWEGAANGTNPKVFSRGGTLRRVGICAGGANAALACADDSECPTSSCTEGRVSVAQVRLGPDDTGADGGWQYILDGCFWYDGAAIPNSYWETLKPISDGVRGNWHSFLSGGAGTVRTCDDTHLWDCLNDDGTPDGTASTIENSQAAQPTAVINFAALSTPTPMPTPLALLVEANAERAVSAAAEFNMEIQIPSPTRTTAAFPQFVLEFSDSGSSAAFHNLPALLTEDSTFLAATSTLSVLVERPASTGSEKMRLTDMTLSVLRQTADPIPPTIIPDRDGDGDDTVCILGDSILANEEFWNALSARLVEPDNLYFCTLGGTFIQDFTDRFAAIVEGSPTGHLKCNVKRGVSGKTCDVMLEMAAINSMHAWQVGRTDNPTTMEGGIGQLGYCELNGAGAQQGKPCACSTTGWRRLNYANGGHGYCVTKGTGAGAFGALCDNSPAVTCTCASNADCTFNGVAGVCSASRCTQKFLPGYLYEAKCVGGANAATTCHVDSECPSGTCQSIGECAGGANAGTTCSQDSQCPSSTCETSVNDECRADRTHPFLRGYWCVSGCIDSPDCAGVCIQPNRPEWIKDDLKALNATHLAYPTPTVTPSGRPYLVFVAPPPLAETRDWYCWYGYHPEHEEFSRWLIDDWAKADSSRLWIDARRAVKNRAPNLSSKGSDADESRFHIDDVHLNASGRALLADLFTECLTNTPLGSVTTATHDGLCASNVCTRGKVTQACTGDADCDTWRCAFEAP